MNFVLRNYFDIRRSLFHARFFPPFLSSQVIIVLWVQILIPINFYLLTTQVKINFFLNIYLSPLFCFPGARLSFLIKTIILIVFYILTESQYWNLQKKLSSIFTLFKIPKYLFIRRRFAKLIFKHVTKKGTSVNKNGKNRNTYWYFVVNYPLWHLLTSELLKLEC